MCLLYEVSELQGHCTRTGEEGGEGGVRKIRRGGSWGEIEKVGRDWEEMDRERERERERESEGERGKERGREVIEGWRERVRVDEREITLYTFFPHRLKVGMMTSHTAKTVML